MDVKIDFFKLLTGDPEQLRIQKVRQEAYDDVLRIEEEKEKARREEDSERLEKKKVIRKEERKIAKEEATKKREIEAARVREIEEERERQEAEERERKAAERRAEYLRKNARRIEKNRIRLEKRARKAAEERARKAAEEQQRQPVVRQRQSAVRQQRQHAVKQQRPTRRPPKFLTVLLFYNDEDLIEDQIEYYKYKNKQDLLVFNNNSSDKTGEIIENHKDDIIKTFTISANVSFESNQVHPYIYTTLFKGGYTDKYDWISFPERGEFLKGPDSTKSYFEHLYSVYRNTYIKDFRRYNTLFYTDR